MDLQRKPLSTSLREHFPQELESQSSESREKNVGDPERVISALGGGAAIAAGFSRGGFLGFSLIGIGAALVMRGLTGSCGMYRALGINTRSPQERLESEAKEMIH